MTAVARSMTVRVFTDSNAVCWHVWATISSRPDLVSAELYDGWLTFDCGSSRRRLAPIPTNWEVATDERLELMCRAANSARTSDPFRAAMRAVENRAFETESPNRDEPR